MQSEDGDQNQKLEKCKRNCQEYKQRVDELDKRIKIIVIETKKAKQEKCNEEEIYKIKTNVN